MLALIGSNGAGKTTLVNLISGLIRADSGRIVFQGADITRASVHQKIARRHRAELPARQPLRPAQRARQRRAGHLLARGQDAEAPLAGRGGPPGAGRGDGRSCSMFGLDDKAADAWRAGLAQGERKLLDVAVAYALRPKLLFLDEPTSGVSTREKAPIMDIISAVVRSERHHRGHHRARHGRGLHLLRPHRGHAPGHDPRRRHARTRSARNEEVLPTCSARRSTRGERAEPDARARAGQHLPRARAGAPRDLAHAWATASRCAWSGAMARARPRPSTASWASCPCAERHAPTSMTQDVTRLPAHQRALLRHRLLRPRTAGIFPDLTVAENFQISQSLARRGRAARGAPDGIDARVFALFPEVADLPPAARALPLRAARRRWWPSRAR